MNNTTNPRFVGSFHRAADADQPWYRSRRFSIFSIVFLACFAVSLAYVYSQPPVYRSSAALLTSAMTPIDRESGDADIQHVAIQRQILLGRELADETLARLKASSTDKTMLRLTASGVRDLLHVEPVEETNLVELAAEGPDPKFLPRIINTWIDVYLDARSKEVKNLTSNTERIVEDELAGLAEKVEAARVSLETFRENNDISSTEREENEAAARLRGLNESLNKANEDEVKARASLEAVKAAIARGKAIVPEDEKIGVLELERRLQDLREKLAEFDKKFTRDYLELQPDLRTLPEQIKELEAAIGEKHRHGRSVVLTEAEMAYAAAQQTVREMRAQLNDHKKQASAFTAKFARHDALKNDLESLEKLYRETQDRLVQVKTGRKDRYPQVNVISRAYEPTDPIRPHYGQEALVAVVGSILLGLFSVWAFEYLTQKKEQSPSITVFGVPGYAPPASPTAGFIDHARAALDSDARRPLVQKAVHALAGRNGQRELSSHQLRTLIQASNLKGKQLIGLLLSGLTVDEAASLTEDQIDLDQPAIRIAGKSPRIVPMSCWLKSLIERSGGRPVWDPEDAGTRVDLSAALVCAAVDSGLPDPQEITADTIRHSYIAYLVRQGLRLSDLELVAGRLDPSAISGYEAYSPPQHGRPITDIELLHPALINPA